MQLPLRIFLWLLACHISSVAGESCSGDSCASSDSADVESLLQVQVKPIKASAPREWRTQKGQKDLVLVHMPYNFGNTVEKVSFMDKNSSTYDYNLLVRAMSDNLSFAIPSKPQEWSQVRETMQPGGEAWGHMNPDLQGISNVTNCPLYLTPPKYWPKELVQKYIGNKTSFSIVRDPYEKLVAQFRGGMKDYGLSQPLLYASCAMNEAIKLNLKKVLETGDMFQGGCTYLPQSEFFDGEDGVQIAVDNWRFPMSMNELFEEHGYDWHIETKDVLHVSGCPEHWSTELDEETRSLVRQVYKKDFELICKSFGHCDFDQNTCLQGVEQMCPESLFTWDVSKNMYCPKADVDFSNSNLRMREECK